MSTLVVRMMQRDIHASQKALEGYCAVHRYDRSLLHYRTGVSRFAVAMTDLCVSERSQLAAVLCRGVSGAARAL